MIRPWDDRWLIDDSTCFENTGGWEIDHWRGRPSHQDLLRKRPTRLYYFYPALKSSIHRYISMDDPVKEVPWCLSTSASLCPSLTSMRPESQHVRGEGRLVHRTLQAHHSLDSSLFRSETSSAPSQSPGKRQRSRRISKSRSTSIPLSLATWGAVSSFTVLIPENPLDQLQVFHPRCFHLTSVLEPTSQPEWTRWLEGNL